MRKVLKALIGGALLGACLVVAGCSHYDPKVNDADAVKYYEGKYGDHVTVTESHGLGNYALFGYNYSGTEFIMSDGTSVCYSDSSKYFADNRQAAEIDAAAHELLERKLGEIPGRLNPIEDVAIGHEPSYETYEGEGVCWHTRYDGGIETFLAVEQPSLSLGFNASAGDHGDGRFTYELAYDALYEDWLEDGFKELGRFFDLTGLTVAVIDRSTYESGEFTLFDDGVHYTITFENGTNGVEEQVHFKPAFVGLLDGITISSSKPGITLSEGDVQLARRSDGFYTCFVSGAASQAEHMEYYIHNDTPDTLLQITGIDSFRQVIGPNTHHDYCILDDGATYFLGDPADIKPHVEIERVTPSKVVFTYHTHFKDQISRAQLNVVGFAYRSTSSTASETVGFDSRILEETPDGWRCEIDIPKNAKPDNTLYIQFTYNDDKDVTVQIEQNVQLP